MKTHYMISVDDDHLDAFEGVARDLTKAGLKVEDKMPEMGLISGSADASRQSVFRKTPGVAHVREETTYSIAPPESTLQ